MRFLHFCGDVHCMTLLHKFIVMSRQLNPGQLGQKQVHYLSALLSYCCVTSVLY